MLNPLSNTPLGKLKAKFNFLNRIGLKNRDFTIISDNCWGGLVYQHFAMEYGSPFANLFLFPPCYLTLLQNFEKNVKLDLSFIDPLASKYVEIMKERKSLGTYPVGMLGKDIELHFLHYKNAADAKSKWNRRKQRIHFDNIMFKFTDRIETQPNHIQEFDELPLKNKVCFSDKPYPYKSVVKIADFQIKRFLNDLRE